MVASQKRTMFSCGQMDTGEPMRKAICLIEGTTLKKPSTRMRWCDSPRQRMGTQMCAIHFDAVRREVHRAKLDKL